MAADASGVLVYLLLGLEPRKIPLERDFDRNAPGIHEGPGNFGLYDYIIASQYALGNDSADSPLFYWPGSYHKSIIGIGRLLVIDLYAGHIYPIARPDRGGIIKTYGLEELVTAKFKKVKIIGVVDMAVTVTLVTAYL
jgi:hypothetical protein